MRNALIVGILLMGGVAVAQDVPAPPLPVTASNTVVQDVVTALQQIPADIQLLGKDLKTNTRFQIDSAISYVANDWRSGTASAGEAIPFLNLGSYNYLAAGASWASKSVSQGTLLNGVRLNGITRPLINKLFGAITLGNIDKVPLLTNLVNATACGVNVGHNFSGPSSKVVINTEGIWFGFELAVNNKMMLSAPSTLTNRTGGVHYGNIYFR